ncbi:MAG: tyrosine--tRNA ligase [Candidatus Omnitrophica bacterium]|nr:tyrosine--tRNA ligase [Candidatus Omnitrophota bacterium]
MNLEGKIDLITRGTSEIINADLLKKKMQKSMAEGYPLRVKAGFDPTAPDIHLGHVVLLRKLRQFQDLGHDVDFLVGDFTALIGDPTGKNKLRPRLDQAFIRDNAKTYTLQAFKILDESKTNVVYNSQWLGLLNSTSLLALTAFSTVGQVLARSDFKQRYESGMEISVMEFIYPLLQGFDSYVLGSDIELGGTDQKFNLLMGRQLQETLACNESFCKQVNEIFDALRNQPDFQGLWPETDMKRYQNGFKPVQEPQVVIMTPLLEGTDGVKKMSKSLNNYIGINEPPEEILGKVMSISDALMMRYYEILTDVDLDDIKTMHPKEAKLQLGENIVSQFYDAFKARAAREMFEKTFSRRQYPDDMPIYVLRIEGELLLDILSSTKLIPSKSEGRRLINQGAVSHEGYKIVDESWKPQKGVVKVGKRRFLRLE